LNYESLAFEIKCLAKSIKCGISLIDSIKLLISSLIPFHIKKLKLIQIKLPYSIKALIPINQLPSIWLNILHIYYDRDYEPITLFVPQKNWTIIDIGAHIGLYTLKAARLVGLHGKVIAIEPNPENYEILKLNMKINSLSNILPIRIAISNKNTIKKLYIPKYSANASFNRNYIESIGNSIEKTIEVRTMKLSDLIEKLKLSHIDLIKIDVEGEELNIVKELIESDIIRNIDKLIIEVHKNIINQMEITNLLEGQGYNVIIIDDIELPYQSFIAAFK